MLLVKGQDGHLYIQPEDAKQTAYLEKTFTNERLAKMVLVGDADQGITVQVRLKPE